MATIKAAEKLSDGNFYIVLSLITLLVFGGSAIVSKALFFKVVRDTKVVNAKNKANSQLDKDVTAGPQLIGNYQSLGPQQTLLSNALPVTPDFSSLLGLLENMSAATGVTLKTVAPSIVTGVTSSSTVSSMNAPTPFGFTASIQGPYVNFQKFLLALETSARPIKINLITSNGTGSDLTSTIDATTFYQAKAILPISKDTIK